MRVPLKRIQVLYLAVFIFLPVTACTVYKPIKSIEPQVALPESFSTGQPLPPIDRWWLEFGDENIETLVNEALSENLTLRMAWSRLDQARQVAKIAGTGRYPELDIEVGGQHQHTSGNLSPDSPENLNVFHTNLTLGYQLDLWKKIENSRLAASLEFEAGKEDLMATALTVAANTVELWASLMEQEALFDLLEDQLEVVTNYLKLVKSRFGQGLSSAVEVYQQKQQVENIRAQFPKIRLQRKLLEHQLSIMLGRPPSNSVALSGDELPELKALPPTGIPAEILRKRPDVRAVELRLMAADHRVASAVADRFPSINLSASIGNQSDEVSNLFDSFISTFAGNIMSPLFDAGKRKAESDRNKAVVRELFYQWKAVFLKSYSEVEDALVTEEELLKTYEITQKQVKLAQLTLDRSRDLYINGLADYLTVLTSLQSLQNLQRTEINIRKSLLSNRIKLHGALGGSWSEKLVPPQITPITH